MIRFGLPNFFKQHGLIILILIFAFFLRVFRLEQLMTFSGDQGIDLLAVRQMLVDHHWSFLGPKTSVAPIFNGPVYYYFLIPFLFIFRLDPLGASYFMILCYLMTILFLYLFSYKFLNKRTGLLIALLFAIWPISVEYSRVSFNSFPTPLFAILFLYGLFKAKQNYYWIILSGFCFGIMMQLHYFNFFLGFLGFFWLLWFVKKKIKTVIIYLISFLIGFSPMLVFEFRHQFFNTKTLFLFFQQKEALNFEWQFHYFISFFPIAFLLLGIFLNWLLEKKKAIGVAIIIFLVILNLKGLNFSRKNGYTMPEGWNFLGVKKVTKIITEDQKIKKNNFNIAAILDGDTRAYPYRYLLANENQNPMATESYPQSEVLYVVGRGDSETILKYHVWEIYSFLPASIEKTWEIQNGVQLFKLIKK